MFGAFLCLWAAITLIAMPVIIIILIISLVKKKTWLKPAIVLPICIVMSGITCCGGFFTMPEDMVDEITTASEETTEAGVTIPLSSTVAGSVDEEIITERVDVMIQQFIDLGFTQDEAKEMKEIFTTVGITEISNIRTAMGEGIDKLQAFICDVFEYSKDKGGISVHFTIEKRQLCFISLDGIPATKTDYYYIDIFGNVKAKTSNSVKSVTLYDVWDENGEIIPDAVGYQAVFDYENSKITAYEQ